MDEWKAVEVEKTREKFELIQIKISNYYEFDNDFISGSIVSNSIEIINNKMIISIDYIDDSLNRLTDIIEKEISTDILHHLEKIDLRDIKNNYIYEDTGNYWSIEYNNIFKICGDFVNTIDEYNKVIEIIDYKNIIKNRIEEIYGD